MLILRSPCDLSYSQTLSSIALVLQMQLQVHNGKVNIFFKNIFQCCLRLERRHSQAREMFLTISKLYTQPLFILIFEHKMFFQQKLCCDLWSCNLLYEGIFRRIYYQGKLQTQLWAYKAVL